ncbi:MAG: response regulator [Proteobacteria bacterium]|nr:response regulator [Pseudomonadota bacterium]NBP14282.1 response regulator [bacterium]
MEQQSMLDTIDADISLVLDNLPVGIIRLDSVKRCVYTNKFILDALDIDSCRDIHSPYIQNIHPDDLDSEKQACHKFLQEHIETETTFRLFNKCQDEYRWMKNKRILLKNTNKTNNTTEVSYMYTLQDVHVNKTMELQLREESKKAEQAYNHKSIFLANMSHEIRTPLNGIIGMLTLLEDTCLSNDQQDYINMVKECSFNLMTIINDILDYSKLEVGKIVLDTKPMNLQECIESTNDIILSKVYEKTLEYTYNINTDVPTHIIADSNRIKQILLNLLSNSIKFTDKGNIFLNVEMIKPEDYNLLYKLHGTKPETTIKSDSVAIRFDITDTGCGINSVDQNKLFKSFSQVDNHITAKVYQGTGLGLAISKELVELMGGCIWLDWSEPHKGSRFSFVIQSEIPVLTDTPVCNDECDSILKNANVLIVDDNLYNRLSLTGIVTKWGMKPHSFSNSEEALYFTRITQFDIGLIDICMPKCDGHTFATKLREQPEFNNKTMPLIALSSLGDKKPASKLFLAHLIKPIKEAKLKQLCVDSLRYRICNSGNTPVTDISSKQSLQYYIENNELITLKDNVRILLAEDVYINQRVVVSFLNKLGFNNIQVVENGQQCLDYVFANKYDIILLDIRMPLLNGEVVLKRIQEHFSDIPEQNIPYVVAVTAYCLREDKTKYLNMGFDDYIPKPVSLKDLSRCMNNFIEGLLHD